MACASSRTLPGNGYWDSAAQARGAMVGGGLPGWRELVQEVLQQQRQVAAPLAQRRDLDVEHVEPVVEVLAEPPLA